MAQHAFFNMNEMAAAVALNIGLVFALNKTYFDKPDNIPIFGAILLAAEVASFVALRWVMVVWLTAQRVAGLLVDECQSRVHREWVPRLGGSR